MPTKDTSADRRIEVGSIVRLRSGKRFEGPADPKGLAFTVVELLPDSEARVEHTDPNNTVTHARYPVRYLALVED